MKSNKFKAVFIPENSEKLSKGTQPMKRDIKKGVCLKNKGYG